MRSIVLPPDEEDLTTERLRYASVPLEARKLGLPLEVVPNTGIPIGLPGETPTIPWTVRAVHGGGGLHSHLAAPAKW